MRGALCSKLILFACRAVAYGEGGCFLYFPTFVITLFLSVFSQSTYHLLPITYHLSAIAEMKHPPPPPAGTTLPLLALALANVPACTPEK